jgi:ribonucleoside-triphosphate reductase
LQGSDIENQNANVDEMSFGGRVGAASDLQMKRYALDYLVSNKSRVNHENNRIYIHDLNAYAVGMHNCLSIPFDDLLEKGFNTRQTDVRPAGSVNTAFQLVAVIFQLQSLQQFGGVSATHLDWTMVPYVRKSFYKHFNDGLVYVEHTLSMDDRLNSTLPIDSEIYKEYPNAYQYAIDMTERETHQAVEGMYHNLNTL